MKRLLTFTVLTVLLHLSAYSQCSNLKLSADKKFQCAPGIVNFKLSGAPVGSSYLWDFGNGYVANTDTVYEFFLNPKVIDVRVQVTFPNGTTCTLQENGIAEILGKPILQYDISRKKLCDGPDTITLINKTSNTQEISWIVDGTNYFNASDTIIHKFKTPGEKNINMVVVDSFGCRNVQEFQKVAIVHADVDVDFYADKTSGCVTKDVQFSSNLKKNGQVITSYDWEFEGTAKKTTATGPNPPSLRYTDAGKYSASLTVTTDKGCTHTLKKEDYLHFGDSIKIELDIDKPTLCLSDSALLKVKAPSPGQYIWNIQGSPDTTMLSGTELTAKFLKPGDYDVTVILNYGGCFSVLSVNDGIKVKEVQARFQSQDNYHCYTPHLTHITNTSTTYNNAALSYQWSVYQDDTLVTTSTKKDFDFSSPDWGRYNVQLVASNSFGCSDTMLSHNFVRVDSIRPGVAHDERVGCVNQNITLRTNTPASSYISSDSFYWVIYDLDGKTVYNQGKGREIEQSFSKPGFYDLKLYAGNTIGCIDSFDGKKFIEIIEPNKGFKVNNPLICAYEEAELQATTTPQNAPFKHTWEVIHQSTSSTQYLETDTAKIRKVKLSRLGKYDVKYVHQINEGCKDSFTRKNVINVNGLVGGIKLSKSSGCLPLNVDANFAVQQNVHIGNSSDDLTYHWSVAPTEGVTISDPNAANPKFTFTKKGVYTIYAHTVNSVSCGFSTKYADIYAGVDASFEISKNKVCAGDSLSLINTSLLNPSKLEWKIFSSGDYDLNTKTDPAILTPKGSTTYDIELIASKDDACFDTMTKRIESIIVTSDFQLTDTHLYCAPAYAQFNTLSVNADTFYWDFGDGSTIASTDPYIANIYQRNTGAKTGFDVTLISKNVLGCADTLTIESAVKIFGPVPKFELTNFVGCEPLQVGFKNNGRDMVRYFLNFDDNSVLDSTNFDSHTYSIRTTNDIQKFIPSVYALDSLGCAAVFESTDTVVVLRKPQAIPSDMEIEGCSPIQVALNDESQKITSRSWLLNGKEISGETSVNPLISDAGNHVIELIVTNQNSCSDTSTFNITVHPQPQVNFTVSTLPCLNEQITVTGQSLNGAEVEKWAWIIDDLALVDTTYSPEYILNFAAAGNYQLRVQAISPKGCVANFDSTLILRGINDIPEGEIEFVTVNDQDEIEIHWNNIDPEFVSLSTVRDNETQQIVYQAPANSESMVSVNYEDLKAQHCFTISHTNFCGDKGIESSSHCPIILSVNKGKLFNLDLSWSAYSGWSNVDNYVIYRSKDFKSFEKIAELDGNAYTYTDSLLCDQDYCYVIEGRHADLSTRSNKDTNRPEYRRNPIAQDVSYATVVNNSHVEVVWNEAKMTTPTTFLLNKYNEFGTSLMESIELDDTSYVDYDLDVTSENYIYKIQTVDHCGLFGLEGFEGKPILLNGHYIDNASRLSWSAYEHWLDGVEFYDIQIQINDEFVTIATVPGGQTAYVDKEHHEEIKSDYIYRIIARSYTQGVSSMSNHITLRGESLVWIPNAFSPNEDDHNPVFKPTPQFVYLIQDGTYREYEMKIFNRWGEELFVTNNIDEGWDGTYKNKDCEMESYLYHIRVTGLDRKVYDKKGLVRLMR